MLAWAIVAAVFRPMVVQQHAVELGFPDSR
jgi:hypothetical protein